MSGDYFKASVLFSTIGLWDRYWKLVVVVRILSWELPISLIFEWFRVDFIGTMFDCHPNHPDLISLVISKPSCLRAFRWTSVHFFWAYHHLHGAILNTWLMTMKAKKVTMKIFVFVANLTHLIRENSDIVSQWAQSIFKVFHITIKTTFSIPLKDVSKTSPLKCLFQTY